MTAEPLRSIYEEIQLPAPVDVVWSALVDPRQLVNWFPLAAEVRPGQGGEFWFSWKNEFESRQRIQIWEERRRLQLVDLPDPVHPQPFLTTLDYQLEPVGEETQLRLVHSGFPDQPSSEQIYEATRRGWQFELRSLRHYLEHHRENSRNHVWLRLACAGRPLELWPTLLGRRGFCAAGELEGLAEGDAFGIETGAGDLFQGKVLLQNPPMDLALAVCNMNHALLKLRLDPMPANTAGERTELNLSLSVYGIHHDDVEMFQVRWQHQLQSLLPGSEALPAPALV